MIARPSDSFTKAPHMVLPNQNRLSKANGKDSTVTCVLSAHQYKEVYSALAKALVYYPLEV